MSQLISYTFETADSFLCSSSALLYQKEAPHGCFSHIMPVHFLLQDT